MIWSGLDFQVQSRQKPCFSILFLLKTLRPQGSKQKLIIKKTWFLQNIISFAFNQKNSYCYRNSDFISSKKYFVHFIAILPLRKFSSITSTLLKIIEIRPCGRDFKKKLEKGEKIQSATIRELSASDFIFQIHFSIWYCCFGKLLFLPA